MGLLAGSVSWAEDLSENKVVIPVQSFVRQSQWHGILKSEATQYSSSVADKKLNQSLLMGANFRWDWQKESRQSAFDFLGEHYVDWNHSQYSVKELFAQQKFSPWFEKDHSAAAIGRKIEFWSVADEQWGLGLWQPLQVFDGLRPEPQGLTGLFWKHEVGPWEFVGYSSPIFIPTMEPAIKNEKGALSSNSRWFRSPSQTFKINNKQRQIVYSINSPDVEDLVRKPGGGARWLYNGQGAGAWGAIGAAYKPMNKLLLKYKKELITDGVNEDTGNAQLYPEVGYHNLFSLDLGYRWAQTEISISYLADRPKDVDRSADDPYILQKASPSRAYSWLMKTALKDAFDSHIFLTYLRVDGGDLEDYDAQGNSQGAVFASRFQYTHATAIGGDFVTSIRGKKTVPRLKFLREFDQRAVLWSGQMDVFLKQNFVAFAGFDILGGDRREDEKAATGFLNEFRANDRAFAGVNYVF